MMITRASLAPLTTGPPANTVSPADSALVVVLAPFFLTTVSLTTCQVQVVPSAALITTPARRPNTAAPTPQRNHFLLRAGREGPGALAGNPPSAGASYIVFIPVSVGLGSWTSPGSPCTAPVSAPRVRCRGAWQYR